MAKAFKVGRYDISEGTNPKAVERRNVKGFVYQANPRLGYHEDFIHDGMWHVDHIPSGCSIYKSVPLEKAKQLIAAIAHLDWNFTLKDFHEVGRKLGPHIRPIFKELGL